MTWIIVLPIVIPLVTAVLTTIVWREARLARWIGVAGAAALLASSIALTIAVWNHGIQATQMGNWPAPFGITLVADHLSAAMVLITGIMGFAVAIFSIADIHTRWDSFGYQSFFHILLCGVSGAFLTGDIFNLYVWFEVMLIASFALLALGGERSQMDGAVKYMALNLVSTILFLIAVGILYGLTGSLNMADLSVRLPEVDQPGLVTTVAMLFMVAFGIKSAVFPVFFWLPASYHTPAVAVSAIFAGLLTKVGVYALIRVFTLIFTEDVNYTHGILLVVAGLTMVTGVLGAAAQNEFRRILSFHIISQIGYMIMGLALYTPLGLVGAVFYVIHHIIVKANLFLVSGVAQRLTGSFELKEIGGLYRSHPFVAILFLIPAFSLAGFPPLSGFWAKLILIKASLEVEQYAIAATALVVGLLTIFSMTKIWGEAFWKPMPAAAHDGGAVALRHPGPGFIYLIAPITGLALITLLIGLWAGPFLDYAARSAEELLDPARYVQAVLEATR